jgi:hypothetical protein
MLSILMMFRMFSFGNGACPSDGSSRFTTNDVALESSGFIPISVMKQFQNEGYKFVHKIDYSKIDGEV